MLIPGLPERRLRERKRQKTRNPVQPKRPLSEGTFDPTHLQLASGEDKLAVVFQARDAARDAGWGKVGVYYREIYENRLVSELVRACEGKTGASFPSVALGISGRIFVGWTETSEGVSQAFLVRGRALSKHAAAQ